MLATYQANEAGSENKWYAIYTRHQHEKTVARVLTSRGFETLVPVCQTVRRWKDRTKVLSLPLFPCYLFLRGGEERRRDILGIPGLHAVVSNGGQPIPIPSREIDSIRQAIESGFPVEPYPYLKCGERVRVKHGPLEGVEGILVRTKSLYRLVLSVDMLGKSASVEVDRFTVERLGKKAAAALVPHFGNLGLAHPIHG